MAFGFYITDIGRDLIAKAATDETSVVISHVKFGDGASVDDPVNPLLTGLKNQVYEKDFDPDYDRYYIDRDTPNIITVTCLLPNEVGDFNINEAGYFDEDGNMVLYGTFAPTPKHVGEHGFAWTFELVNNIEFSSEQDRERIEFKIELGNIAELEQKINDVTTRLEEMVIYACDSEDIREIIGDVSLPYDKYKPDYADEEDIDHMFD